MVEPLRIRAVNTAADSENKIHDDRTAAQYGFRGGLVPGVTVYGYLAAAAIAHFGDPWLSRGVMDVRFLEPVYEGDEAIVTLAPDPGGPAGRVRVSIAVDTHLNTHLDTHINRGECAWAVAWLHEPGEISAPSGLHHAPHQLTIPDRRTPTAETLAPGTVLDPLSQPLDLAQSRISAPLDSAIMASGTGSPEDTASKNSPRRFAHPAVLLALANEIFVKNYALGPWIHTASQVRKFSAVRDGEHVLTSARIEDRFARKGHEFVVLDVVIGARPGAVAAPQNDCRIVEHIRHTAIWRPRAAQAE